MKADLEVPQNEVNLLVPRFIVFPKAEEFARGGTAALVNILCTFPINKVMFRQQLTGSGMVSVGKELYHEGVRLLYRGVGAPIMQKTISTSLMFGTYDVYRRSLLYMRQIYSGSEARETVWIRFIASSCSGLTEALLTPFERVQTLLQIPRYNARFSNFFDAFRQLGFRESFTGLSAIAIRNCLGSGLFLFFREPLQHVLPHSSSALLNLLSDFVSGAVLGACISTLSFPFSVAKVQLQKNVTHRPGYSVAKAIRDVVAERGSVAGLYKGAQVNFYRALLSWGIVNAVYEQLHLLFH